MQRGKPKISTWPRMKKLMVNFLFPLDYDEIFFYTSYGHRLKEFT